MVPSGARVLVFDGEDVAFTDPQESGGSSGWGGYPGDAPDDGALLKNVEKRVQDQRYRNEADFEEQYQEAPAPAAVNASAL